MKSLVEMVLGGRENAKEAKKKLIQYKAKIVQEVNEESKELMRQALEEVSAILKKKHLIVFGRKHQMVLNIFL